MSVLYIYITDIIEPPRISTDVNDKDVLETKRDQLDNRYHRDKER